MAMRQTQQDGEGQQAAAAVATRRDAATTRRVTTRTVGMLALRPLALVLEAAATAPLGGFLVKPLGRLARLAHAAVAAAAAGAGGGAAVASRRLCA
jgi:hypothetical protein